MNPDRLFAPTRWKCRAVVRRVNAVLHRLKLEKHPSLIFIGKITRGFDFLGDHFSLGGLKVARSTVQKFAEQITRLY